MAKKREILIKEAPVKWKHNFEYKVEVRLMTYERANRSRIVDFLQNETEKLIPSHYPNEMQLQGMKGDIRAVYGYAAATAELLLRPNKAGKDPATGKFRYELNSNGHPDPYFGAKHCINEWALQHPRKSEVFANALRSVLDRFRPEGELLRALMEQAELEIPEGSGALTIPCNQNFIDLLQENVHKFRWTRFEAVKRKGHAQLILLREAMKTVNVEIGNRISDRMKYKINLHQTRTFTNDFMDHIKQKAKDGIFHLTPNLKDMLEMKETHGDNWQRHSWWSPSNFLYVADEQEYFLLALSYPNIIKNHVQIFTVKEAQNVIKKSSNKTGKSKSN